MTNVQTDNNALNKIRNYITLYKLSYSRGNIQRISNYITINLEKNNRVNKLTTVR